MTDQDNVRVLAPSAPHDLLPARDDHLREILPVGGLALDDEERAIWRERAERIARARGVIDVAGQELLTICVQIRRVSGAASWGMKLAEAHPELLAWFRRVQKEAQRRSFEIEAGLGDPVAQECLAILAKGEQKDGA